MRLRVRALGLEAGGKPIVVLNKEDADDLGIMSQSRVRMGFHGKELTAIVNTTRKTVEKGVIGVFEEVRSYLSLEEDVEVEVNIAGAPKSLHYIREKLGGRKLTSDEIIEIVSDVVKGNLSEIEIAAFVTALHNLGLDLDEATSLSMAMVKTGESLKLDRLLVVDKHSVGGVPGDKTTLLVVPIVAACGLTIPKTSSRAITSAAGSADRAEVLMPVSLNINEMRRVVERTNGCLIWGGALYLAPADDIFLQVEHPLSIDPLLLPSIMGKKKAVGANVIVIDIPCGRGTKVKTIGEANFLAKDFIELGKRLDMRVQCAITYGEQPVGYAIGPALEAREALSTLMNQILGTDIVNKATHIAGILLEMTGIQDGQQIALDVLRSGKAEKKLREIIGEQGGNPGIRPEDIKVGSHTLEVYSQQAGRVLWVDNARLVEAARAAGAPKDKGAGVMLHRKLGDRVKEKEKLLTVYAERMDKLSRAKEILGEGPALAVGERMEMLIQEVKEVPVPTKLFILER